MRVSAAAVRRALDLNGTVTTHVSSHVPSLPMRIASMLGEAGTEDPSGHSVAGLGCPLHSAARVDRFRAVLGEVFGRREGGLDYWGSQGLYE
jgi:hypothetical protein